VISVADAQGGRDVELITRTGAAIIAAVAQFAKSASA
jgi:hypothetical protein